MLSLILAAAMAASPGSTPETAIPASRSEYVRWPGSYQWFLDTPQTVWEGSRSGRVVLRCKITDFGDLARCEVVEEDPKGLTLGKAALKLKSKVKMTPTPKGEERWRLFEFGWSEGFPIPLAAH
jgi:hypothetical protein